MNKLLRYVLTFAIISLLSFGVIAYNVQTGYVKTRGRLDASGKVIPGKRISNVLIVIKGGNSAKSDASGDFSLKVPANNFYLSNIKKENYIVSDPDILSKSYSCSPNPLLLVLDEPAVQVDDRLASERKLRRTLQKRLQEREDEIETLKEQNKITQDEYHKRLQKLYAEQESNEKFIAEMADKYSKMDFDQLDEFQARMAALIQNGELARADSLLRTKGSMDDREAEINRLRNANKEERIELNQREENLKRSEQMQQQLLTDFGADCYSHFEICKLKCDNDSAAYWIERRAQADTTNVDWLFDAGAFIHEYLADYPQALQYYHRALSRATAQFGENHPDVATCYNNIGNVYNIQGDYTRALEYYDKALKILLHNDENHPDVATSYNNIGILYSSQDNYTRAWEYYDKALKIRLQIFGENHPDVAACYNHIGSVYYYQGDYTRALEYYDKALKIQLLKLGENHPDVAACYNHIGAVYDSQGDYTRALEYYDKALKIRLLKLGENHPYVATCFYNIGLVYYRQGDYSQALENYDKALKIQLQIFGENHPDIAERYNNIGAVYDSQCDYTRALENFEKALKIRLQIFGENHSDVAKNYGCIGLVYDSQGEYTRALEYLERALTISHNFFDDNNSFIIDLKNFIQEVKGKLAEKQ